VPTTRAASRGKNQGKNRRKAAVRTGTARRRARSKAIRIDPARRQRALLTVQRLRDIYPAATELAHENPFQMLIATILSAQTTDRSVNLVTPKLFKRYPDAAGLAHADPVAVEAIIKPTGFFHTKAKTIIGASRAVEERFAGRVPGSMEELVTLPGVGRKTANVVLGVAFDVPGFAVDTHVIRLSKRIGLSRFRDPEKIEAEVTRMVPPEEWTGLSLRLILHGRRICIARAPRCPECVLNDFCPTSTVRREGQKGGRMQRPLAVAKRGSALPRARRREEP
jgi:endonuclease-3